MTFCSVPYTWEALGLLLDVAGVVMLFIFGIPPEISPNGAIYIIAEGNDPAEAKKYKRYKFWSRVALSLLILGFLGQFSSNYCEHIAVGHW